MRFIIGFIIGFVIGGGMGAFILGVMAHASKASLMEDINDLEQKNSRLRELLRDIRISKVKEK